MLDKNDPFIRGEAIKVMDGKSGYMLHELETEGEPLVHLTTRTRPEIVLFGIDQKFTAPLYLTAGKHIIVTAQAGTQTASVVKFTPDRPDERREVELNVADVIRAVSELDGTYPDVVQMLTEAADQNNLEGRFAHDSLPEGGRIYERPAPSDGIQPKGRRKTRIGRDNLAPNMFPLDPSKDEKSSDESEEPEDHDDAMASVREEKTGGNVKRRSSRDRQSPDEDRASFWPTWLTPKVHHFENEAEESEDEPLPAAKETPKAKRSAPDNTGEQTEPQVGEENR